MNGMNCRAWEDLLQRQLDGDAPAALQRHLLDCPGCAAQRASLNRLLTGIAQLRPAEPPPGLADRLAPQRLDEARTAKMRRRRWRIAFASLASAAALLIAAGLWSWSLPGTPRNEHGLAVSPPVEPPPALRDS